MNRYIKREDAVFAACKVLDKFGGCKMGPLCPDVGCCEVRDIIDAFPMIEIPEKHGRLIDASEKIRVQMYDDMTEDYHIAEMTIDDLLSQGWVEADAPTIIQAEPPKEE